MTVGICGGLAAFSSCGLQMMDLLQAGRAAAYAALPVGSCLLSGWALGRM